MKMSQADVDEILQGGLPQVQRLGRTCSVAFGRA